MTLKELIYAEIDKIEEENLGELYEVVQRFVHDKVVSHKPGTLSRLKQIKIQAPVDFAANADLYLSGEKQLADNPDLR